MLGDDLSHALGDGGLVALVIGGEIVDALDDLLHLLSHKTAGGDHGRTNAHAAGDAGLLGIVGDGVLVQGDVDAVQLDRKSTRLNSSHKRLSRMPSSA